MDDEPRFDWQFDVTWRIVRESKRNEVFRWPFMPMAWLLPVLMVAFSVREFIGGRQGLAQAHLMGAGFATMVLAAMPTIAGLKAMLCGETARAILTDKELWYGVVDTRMLLRPGGIRATWEDLARSGWALELKSAFVIRYRGRDAVIPKDVVQSGEQITDIREFLMSKMSSHCRFYENASED